MKEIETRKALKPKDVTRQFGIPVQSLANDRCNRRGLPYSKVGTSIYYMVKDIEAYLRSKRIDPNN